jgi:hypothetical protein
MSRPRLFSLLARSALLAFVLPGRAAADDPLFAAFREPPARYRPFVRWWWNGGCVTGSEILRELDMLKAAGIGGVEINTIAMPDGTDPATLAGARCHEWLSPEWSRLVREAALGARERGMAADLIVGSGWPFGGRFLEGPERTQRVSLVKKALRGPGAFAERLDALAAERERRRDEVAVPPELAFLRLVPAGLTRFEPGTDLRTALGADGTIRFEVPPGDHVLYVGIREEGYTHVKLGAPGADGPVLDHFDEAAVRKYLDRMSTKLGPVLGGRLGDALRATFVDSLELDFANWTGDLPAEFERRRGYALEPYLPFVLDVGGEREGTPLADTVRRARYDFHRTVVELFEERFLSTYAEWCRANGVLSRVQAYGRETDPIEGGRLVDVPEGESWFWSDHTRILPSPTVVDRYVSSAARLAGKRLASYEAMTNAVPVFRATPADMKRLYDESLLTGVLHPVIHGFNYSPREAGFPGWVRFGTWLNERNPWWPYLRLFTDYAARLTTVFAESDGEASIALLGPKADEWARYRRLYQPFPEVALPWYHYALGDALAEAGYGSDFVSERVLQEATASDGRLRYGSRSWEALLVLDAESVEPATAAALAAFARAGGKVLFVGRAPSRSPGLAEAAAHDEAVREAVKQARSAGPDRVALVPAPAPGPLDDYDYVRLGLPAFARRSLLYWVTTTLPAFGIVPPVRIDAPRPDVAQIRHRVGDREIVLFAHTGRSNPIGFRARLTTGDARPWRWDPETGTRAPYPFQKRPDDLWIHLEPSESLLLVFEPAREPAPGPEAAKAEAAAPVTLASDLPPKEWMTLSGEWDVSFHHGIEDRSFARRLRPLEDLSLSPDPELSSFAGTAVYRTTFEVPDARFDRLDLGALNGVATARLNGRPLGVRWWGRPALDVRGALAAGRNTLEVEVTTTVANYAHSLRDNPAAQRWASWFPPIPTGLEGPVRLVVTSRGGASAPVAEQPERFVGADVAHRVARPGRDEQLLARAGTMDHTLDLELHVTLDDHDELVDVVDVVGPDLAGRIHPETAREPALAPASGHGVVVDPGGHQTPSYTGAAFEGRPPDVSPRPITGGPETQRSH